MKYVDHDLTNDVFIFWALRSDHLELRNTLPSELKVDFSLLLRSKNIRK